MRLCLSFDDLLMVPQFSKIESRSTVDISTNLGNGLKLNLPVIASPMNTVTEGAMAFQMARNGGLAIIHRYNSIEEQVNLLQKAKVLWTNVYQNDEPFKVGAAIGVGGDFLDRARALVEQGIRILCIDVAHGHHILVKKAIQILRKEFGNDIHIMAGNIATGEGYRCLAHWGADSVRLGIGGGSICSTRIQTGHGVPLATTIIDCVEIREQEGFETTLIADGGIKNGGDIVKALALGANAVMCGSLLAGTDEAPGDVMVAPGTGKKFKRYAGMASRDAKKTWRDDASSPEGISTTVPYKGPVSYILSDLAGNIRSGFSYSGAINLKELQESAMFIQQTSAGQFESSTHILNK